MGLLDHAKRVYLDPTGQNKEDWVDVRQLSLAELRSCRRQATNVEPQPGEEKIEAQGFELTRLALELCVVGWSDENTPVNPENIGRLPYELGFRAAAAAGLGSEPLSDEDEEAGVPLPATSPTNASSPENPEESSPMST